MLNDKKGLTLIELVLVLAIFSLAVSIVFPNFAKIYSQYQLRSTANQLVADIRGVRQESIFGKAYAVRIFFNDRENHYVIFDGTYRRQERFLPKGISFHDLPLSGRQLYFSLIGAPSDALTIVLKNNFNDFFYIYLMPSTGRIRTAFGDQSGGDGVK